MAEEKKRKDEGGESKSSDTPMCVNHPRRKATFTSESKAFETLHFCDECVPAHWR